MPTLCTCIKYGVVRSVKYATPHGSSLGSFRPHVYARGSSVLRGNSMAISVLHEQVYMAFTFQRSIRSQLSMICNTSRRLKIVSRSNSVQCRPFVSSLCQLTDGKPMPNTSARLLQPSKRSRTRYESFSDSLARRASPTLLYQAPSPHLHIAGCYVLSTACFAYGGFNFYNTYLHPPEYIASWIPVTVGGVCIAMVGFGIWSIFGV
jgi:hypothetical protein